METENKLEKDVKTYTMKMMTFQNLMKVNTQYAKTYGKQLKALQVYGSYH